MYYHLPTTYCLLRISYCLLTTTPCITYSLLLHACYYSLLTAYSFATCRLFTIFDTSDRASPLVSDGEATSPVLPVKWGHMRVEV